MKSITGFWVVYLFIVLIVLGMASTCVANETIVMGITDDFPPFTYFEPNGRLTGFNVELMRELSQVLGWELEIKIGTWSQIMEWLGSGQIDVSMMLYSSQRAEQFAFSTELSVATYDIFTRSGLRLKNLEQLNGQRVVVEKDSLIQEYLMEQNLDLVFVLADTIPDVLRLVASGDEDYAAILSVTGHYSLQKYQLNNLEGSNLHFSPSYVCFAVNKDNTPLQLRLNNGLQILKATGKYGELYGKWLGIYEENEAMNWKIVTRWLAITLAVTTLIFVWALISHRMVQLRTADLIKTNKKLSHSRQELAHANEELRSTVQQLTKISNELTTQYVQLQLVEAELAEEKDLLRTTLLSVGEGIVVTNRLGEVVMINQVAEKLTGWLAQSAIGHFYHDLFPGDHGQVVAHVIYGEKTIELGEQLLRSKDGEEIIVASTISPILDGQEIVRGTVVVFRDISESVRQRKEIEYLSFHDPLTGLFNRRGFKKQMDTYNQEQYLPLALITADVNGLKLMNDSFGHTAGDELLVKVAKILEAGAPTRSLIARTGGDEFILVLAQTNYKEAEAIVKRINQLTACERVCSVSISIAFGIAVKEHENQDFQEVFNLAEERMYADKFMGNVDNGTLDSVLNTLVEQSIGQLEHSRRVARLARDLGKALGLSGGQVSQLYTLGLLHDIGKAGMEEHAFQQEEDSLMEEHRGKWGHTLLRASKELERMARSILDHEAGKSSGEIPYQAQVIALADTYDALIRDASGQVVANLEQVVDYLKQPANNLYDLELVDLFIKEILPKQDHGE